MRPAPEYADDFDLEEDVLVDDEVELSNDDELDEDDWREYAYGADDGY